nr:glycosyltransferase family 4 protein [Aquimarina sp. U1-2]
MKVLIITYYWPPAGGPGVQRWLAFVKYFREFGIEPIVYVPENPTYALKDDSFTDKIPEGITVLKQPIFEPYKVAEVFSKKDTRTISKGIIAGKAKQSWIQKLLLYIRGNFFIPDARKYWVKPSVTYLKTYLLQHPVDLVITTGPPHSVHLIGMHLKKELNIKWITDFRDPWTTIGYHNKLKLTKKSAQKHKNLEKQVLYSADHIVVTSYTTKKEFLELTHRPITVVTNGYDEEGVPIKQLDSKFTISHIGSLLSGRDPKNLWKALNELTQENESFANAFTLQLVGAVSDDVISSIKEAGLHSFLDLKGYVSHREALQIQRSSQVLLLIEIDSAATKCIIPGKLFEYMAAKRPILALGPKDADIARLIKETNAGCFFEYQEYTRIKDKILHYFTYFQEERLHTEIQGIEKFSRRALTKHMCEIIRSV